MASSYSKNSTDNNDYNDNTLLEFDILNSLKDFIGSEPFGQYLSEYIGNTLRNIDRLGFAIASEDEERVKQFSHKLKGSAGNIGAIKLSNICTRIQTIATDEDSQESLASEYQELQSTYQETRKALSDYIGELEKSRLKAG